MIADPAAPAAASQRDSSERQSGDRRRRLTALPREPELSSTTITMPLRGSTKQISEFPSGFETRSMNSSSATGLGMRINMVVSAVRFRAGYERAEISVGIE